jgi:hypothetical protein
MTVQNAIIDVYEMLGEPSDLPIYAAGGAFSIAAYGSVRILRMLNAAQDYVSTYRIPSGVLAGRALYFRELDRETTFEPVYANATLPAQVDATFKTILLDATLSASAAGRFDGWIATFDGIEARRVMRHTVAGGNGTLVLDEPLAADATGAALVLRKVTYAFDGGVDAVAAGRVLEVAKLIDMSTYTELEYEVEDVTKSRPQVGTPSAFSKKGGGFAFDVACEDLDRTYTVATRNYPELRTLATEQLALPQAFHAAIVLYAVSRGHQRMMETTSAYAVRRDFDEMMRTLQTQIDMEDSVYEDRITPEVR